MSSHGAKTVRQEMVEVLRARILNGQYLPGDRIIESVVATEFSISRGPVREAIRQLEQEGLVVYHLHKGCSVRTLTADDAWEIYLLRSNLESLALHLCSGVIDHGFLKRMEEIVTAMRGLRQDDVKGIVELDNEFHSQICQASGKKRLQGLWSSLNSTSYAIFLTIFNTNTSSIPISLAKHELLLQILIEGNLDKSRKAIYDHYLSTGEKLYLYENRAAERLEWTCTQERG